MRTKLFTIIVVFLISYTTKAQSQLQVKSFLRLPKDTIVSTKLTETINQFLMSAQEDNEKNKWIFPKEKTETFILLDEINGIEKSRKYKDDHFYKPYLSNLAPLSNGDYLIQVSYMGTIENEPTLRAIFEFIAHKSGDSYLFSSPIIRNTKDWKHLKKDMFTFHYKSSINKKYIDDYCKYATIFDQKIGSTPKKLETYLCKDANEVLKLMGVLYKLDYNGRNRGGYYSVSNDKMVSLSGSNNETFDRYDRHDLWHDRLSIVISRRKVNKPIDEAIAYMYGGSWGYSWDDILKIFKEKVVKNKNVDWASYKENPFNFNDTQSKHLMVDYVVNAIILIKLEKEKDFSAVWELLNCGPYEKGNANYYKALEKLTGITKENYNEKVWELVNEI